MEADADANEKHLFVVDTVKLFWELRCPRSFIIEFLSVFMVSNISCVEIGGLMSDASSSSKVGRLFFLGRFVFPSH